MSTAAAPPAWFFPLLLGVPLLLALVGAVWLVRVVPRVRRALPAEGVVVDVARQSMHEGRRLWRLTVEYRDVEGRLQRGLWVGRSSLDPTDYRPGMPVPVRYDPREPRWVHLPGSGRPHPYVVPAGLVVVGAVVVGIGLVVRLGFA